MNAPVCGKGDPYSARAPLPAEAIGRIHSSLAASNCYRIPRGTENSTISMMHFITISYPSHPVKL